MSPPRWAGGDHPGREGRPLVVAHRGASAAFPENTVAAFAAARDLGADWVELDVHALADGAVAVHHDHVLADGRPLAAVRAGDLPAGVPLLDEALAACAGMGVNIEVKAPPGGDPDQRAATAVAEAVAAGGHHGRVVVSSFDWGAVDRVAAVDPAVPTALLASAADPGRLVAAARRRGCVAVHPHVALVDRHLVAAAHGDGLAVTAWTVDDPLAMGRLLAAGVDGIVTNVPDVARRVVDAV